ncbi:MAG: hypothetical protein Q4E31_04390 [Intestinibacter bartlettii]|nr:hypothetical protein [Intestinibacter bartlettii]MDO5010043.1 hypothetical protein [Intestinibacter bartlettii]
MISLKKSKPRDKAKAMGFEFKSDDEGADLAVTAVQQLALDVKLPLF